MMEKLLSLKEVITAYARSACIPKRSLDKLFVDTESVLEEKFQECVRGQVIASGTVIVSMIGALVFLFLCCCLTARLYLCTPRHRLHVV